MSRLELQAAGFAPRPGTGVERHWLVHSVDLVVGAESSGAVLALVGPNGAGKSTVLRLMAGVWEPSEGEVLLDGKPLRAVPRRRVAAQIAYVPQSSSIALDFTVRELVAMGRYLHRGRLGGERADDRRAVETAMGRADVETLASRSVTQLSGGELQRVLIARSLATEAEILLLDEPTANLDIAHALDVMALCRTLAADGHQVVVAMHDLNLARRHACRIAVLDHGRVDAIGPPLEVLTRERLERVFQVAVVGPIDDAGRSLHFEPSSS